MGAKAVRVAIERIFIRLFAVEGDLGIVGYVVTIDTFGFVIKIVFVNSPIVLYPCEIEEGSPLFHDFCFSCLLLFRSRYIYSTFYLFFFFLFFVRRVHSRDPFFAKNFN